LPSFNEIGYILLAMYFQMSKQGKAYTPKPERIVGDNPFSTLNRNEMVARTNIQAQAFAFVEDKVNEKVLDLSLYQAVRQEPLIAKNPDAVHFLLKTLVEGWSKKWKNAALKVIPSMEQFQKQKLEAALNGVVMYAGKVLEDSKVTGVEPQIDPEQLLAVVSDLQAQLVTPVDPAVQKEQEKNA